MSLTQTINKNRKSMNKEYFVLEIEDTSSAEYRKNYWKKAAEILLERIYQREQCISEKVKNIIKFWKIFITSLFVGGSEDKVKMR